MSFDKKAAPRRNFIMLIGYARVSTQDQNLELQTDALRKAGCKKLFEDKVTGSRAERPGLTKAQEALREGDTLVVWKLDRLGRSVKNLVDLVGELHKQGVQFKSLTDAIDTGTPSGRFFFHVMASLAEMERELTIERTRAGLEVARKLGRKGGRKRQMTESKIKSAKKLLGAEYRLATWPVTSESPCQHSTAGFRLPPWPNVRYGPFSEGIPGRFVDKPEVVQPIDLWSVHPHTAAI
jgi:DNA invertase Pin-like site-specific DNA recombinase